MGLSRSSARALRPCPLDLEEMPEAVCPHFILKLLLRVSSCLCRCQAAPFPPASGNSSWKLVMDGISSLWRVLDPAAQPGRPRERRRRVGAPRSCLCAVRNLGGRGEEGFNFQSTPTPCPLSAWRQEMLRGQIGDTEDAGHAGFRPLCAPQRLLGRHRGPACSRTRSGGSGRGGGRAGASWRVPRKEELTQDPRHRREFCGCCLWLISLHPRGPHPPPWLGYAATAPSRALRTSGGSCLEEGLFPAPRAMKV